MLKTIEDCPFCDKKELTFRECCVHVNALHSEESKNLKAEYLFFKNLPAPLPVGSFIIHTRAKYAIDGAGPVTITSFPDYVNEVVFKDLLTHNKVVELLNEFGSFNFRFCESLAIVLEDQTRYQVRIHVLPPWLGLDEEMKKFDHRMYRSTDGEICVLFPDSHVQKVV